MAGGWVGTFPTFFFKIIAYIIIRFISLFDCAGFYRSGSFFGLRNIYMVWLNIRASTCLSSKNAGSTFCLFQEHLASQGTDRKYGTRRHPRTACLI